MANLVHSGYWPFLVLFLSVGAVVVLITRLRFHPFVALTIAAVFVGLISPAIPGMESASRLVTAVELPMQEFGIMAGRIAWVIAMAAVTGWAMMESGAAECIVNRLLATLGEKRASVALLVTGFILSIPIFFDTVFFLMIPLGITLALKTGKDFVLYVVSIAGGAAITHSTVPPTPGPLIMAETLGIDLGTVIAAGIVTGIIPALAALGVAVWLNRRLVIPVRTVKPRLNVIQDPPSLTLSLLPVIVPLGLISLASFLPLVAGHVPPWVDFMGNKNVAMGAGALVALLLWKQKQGLRSDDLWKGVVKPLEVAGIIVLITSAGGAYGAMIKHSGIAESIRLATASFPMHEILLAWIIAAIMKIAQGSGTVSMITSSAIMAALIGNGAHLPYHPVYILLAIGFGSVFISWMNDSGFWVVVRMSGFTEKEGLQTWTFTLAVIAVTGLAQVLMLAWLFPMI